MNDLKDFDFYCDYAYSYCARHLEEDGWSRKEFGKATELYKKKLKALEIIKELLHLKAIQLLPNDSDTRLFVKCGNFKASILIPPQYIELLKEVLKND